MLMKTNAKNLPIKKKINDMAKVTKLLSSRKIGSSDPWQVAK